MPGCSNRVEKPVSTTGRKARGFGASGNRHQGRSDLHAPEVNLTVPLAFLLASELTPAHTNCSPAQMAITATTAFNFCAGTIFASTHPSKTPGIPPAMNGNKTTVLMDPNVQWTA